MSIPDRTTAPEIKDYTDFELVPPQSFCLQNGITVKHFDNKELDLIHFQLKVKAGSCYEPKKNVAAFCYLLLKESAPQHEIFEVEEFLDYYGVNYSVSISIEYVTISFIIPKNNCLIVLPYIFDFLLHPCFKETNLQLLKERKIKDLAVNKEKVGYCASQLMLRQIFGDSCMVGKILEESDLRSITTNDLQQYFQQSFCAENIRAFTAGNLSAEISECFRQLCGDIPHGHANSFQAASYTPHHQQEPIIDLHPDCMQSSFYLCRKSIAYNDECRRDFGILSAILGGYFGSRLMSNLRETHGYTYGISCGSIYYEDSSLFYIESEVNVDTTAKAIEECYKEMDILTKEPVTEEELLLIKNYLSGQLLRKVDNTVSWMTQYANWDDFGLGETEFKRQLQTIRDFNAEKGMNLARQMLQAEDFFTIVSGQMNEQLTSDK